MAPTDSRNDRSEPNDAENDRVMGPVEENDPRLMPSAEGSLPEAETVEGDQRPVSRRSFLSGALAGGGAGLALAAGAGVGVWKAMDVQAQQAAAVAQEQIARLQGLVDRYEKLEKIGLDGILKTGMAAVTLPLEGVELGAKALKGGLDLVEGALRALQGTLPSAEEAIVWLEERVSALAGGIGQLEAALAKALDRLAATPVGERLRDLAALILDKLPFGLGDKMRDALDGLVSLVTGVDELIRGINSRALEPLRAVLLAKGGPGLGEVLLDPLVEHLLDPLEAHLAELATLLDSWEEKLAAPARQALEERAQVREEIERYKEEHGLR